MSGLINDKPLLRSGVGNRIWELKTDSPQFKEEVRKYFEKAMPGWMVVRANLGTKTIYLRDERMRGNAR